MTQYRNFIGGRFVDKAGLAEIEVRNPANGQIFTTVPAADDADVIAAVEAAKSAQKLWRKLAAIQRGNACANWPMRSSGMPRRLARRWRWNPARALRTPSPKPSTASN